MKAGRIIALIVFLAFYLGVIALLALLAVKLLNEGSLTAAIIFIALDIAFLVDVIWGIRKKYRERKV